MALLAPDVVNPELEKMEVDYLYHLGLTTLDDLKELFGDVKVVCMGGSAERAEDFAEKLVDQFDLEATEYPKSSAMNKIGRLAKNTAVKCANILGFNFKEQKVRPIAKTERFSLYKVGPVISVSHGMGMPSMSILLNEITKLLHYAGCEDVEFIRIGTSGGVGVEPGTVIITSQGINEKLEAKHEKVILGKTYEYETDLNEELATELYEVRGEIRADVGKTLGTNDFYEGQGRGDGAKKPEYSEEEKMEFLQKAHKKGILNIEMESTEFAAWCKTTGIKGAIVCAALLNRLEGDQVTSTPEELAMFSDNAQQLVMNYLYKKLIVEHEVKKVA